MADSYEVDEECLSFDGYRLYNARVLDVNEASVDPYLIHFQKWSSSYDRWVPVSHLVKKDADGLAYQQELEATHKATGSKGGAGGGTKGAGDPKAKAKAKAKAKEASKEPSKKKKIALKATATAAAAAEAVKSTRKEVPPLVFALLTDLVSETKQGEEKEKGATTRLGKAEFKSELEKMFTMFDVDKSGTIDKTELAAVMKAMGMRPLKRKVNALFETLDVDGDGSLQFEEFLKFFTEKDLLIDSKLYCTCQTLSKGFMVACDGGLEGCKEWYHGKCVGVDEKSSSLKDVWFCSTCVAQTKSNQPSKYRTVKGVKYDRVMLDTADQAEGGLIDLASAKQLVADVVSDEKYSKIERRTMALIRHSGDYKLNDDADHWIRKEIRGWAARKAIATGGNKKRKKPSEPAHEAPSSETTALAKEALATATNKESKPNRLKRGNTMAFKLKLRNVFNMVDADKSDNIDKFEVRAVMRNLGIRPTKTSVDIMFEAMDTDGNGTIDFEEFCHYFLESKTEEDDTLYCKCQQKAGGKFMVCCDAELEGCAVWYHGECVGLKETDDYPKMWFCPACSLHIDQSSKKSNSKKLLESYKKVHKRKYDRAILEVAEKAMLEKKEINLEDAKKLVLNVVLGDGKYTKVEKNTMKYIRASPNFTLLPEADKWFRFVISSFTSRMSHWERKAASKTSAATDASSSTEKKVEPSGVSI